MTLTFHFCSKSNDDHSKKSGNDYIAWCFITDAQSDSQMKLFSLARLFEASIIIWFQELLMYIILSYFNVSRREWT